jgi:hypothetical protein
LVYGNSSFTPGNHHLVISSGGNMSSVIAFDYAKYTFVYRAPKVFLDLLIFVIIASMKFCPHRL